MAVIKANRESKAQPSAEQVLKKFRTRWMRWLGNKTRENRPDWTDLLQSNWSGWASQTLAKNGIEIKGLNWQTDSNPITIREYFKKAINVAQMDDLYKLDGLYCWQNTEKRMRRK